MDAQQILNAIGSVAAAWTVLDLLYMGELAWQEEHYGIYPKQRTVGPISFACYLYDEKISPWLDNRKYRKIMENKNHPVML